jgi:hypothetical protein
MILIHLKSWWIRSLHRYTNFSHRSPLVLTTSLAQQLKEGHSLLYHTLKYYNLAPQLNWMAGGYTWPIGRVVDCSSDAVKGFLGKSHGFPTVRGP